MHLTKPTPLLRKRNHKGCLGTTWDCLEMSTHHMSRWWEMLFSDRKIVVNISDSIPNYPKLYSLWCKKPYWSVFKNNNNNVNIFKLRIIFLIIFILMQKQCVLEIVLVFCLKACISIREYKYHAVKKKKKSSVFCLCISIAKSYKVIMILLKLYLNYFLMSHQHQLFADNFALFSFIIALYCLSQ